MQTPQLDKAMKEMKKLHWHKTQNQITKAYIRHYSDNGQTTAYIEWSDGSRTEGTVHGNGCGLHMRSLLQRAVNSGLKIEKETW